jgi:3-hydroxyisobutyrate dehydrogenase
MVPLPRQFKASKRSPYFPNGSVARVAAHLNCVYNTAMTPRTAFIGLGIMGGPMAGHLLKAGFPLAVHTRTKSRAAELLAQGARWANSPADAAREADVVFICVPDTPDVQAVVSGNDGLLSTARAGQIVIDHSSISPTATRQMAEQLAAKGVRMLDAPISGGDVGARNATLSIMVGGDEEAFNQARRLLEKLGKTITYCGPSGNGQLTKLVNQILVSVTNLAVSEAMTFARASGLDPQKTVAAVGGGAAGSWQLTNLGPKMLAGDFRPGFMIKLQQKDLRLALQAAQERGLRLGALRLVHQLFGEALKEGRADEGTQALFAVVEKQAKGA